MSDATKLYRHIHPAWIRNNRVTSQAFCPTAKDEQRLSVYDGDQISAKNAFKHYSRGHESAGVLAVTVGECSALGLTVVPEPSLFPEHLIIDFSPFGRSQSKRIAKKLAELARARGWQYAPSGTGT